MVKPDVRLAPVHAPEAAPDGTFPGAETGEYLALPASFADGVTVCRVRETVMRPLIMPGAYVGIGGEDAPFRNGDICAVKTERTGVVLRRAYVDSTESDIVLQALDPDCPPLRFTVETFRQRFVGRLEWTLQRA